MPVLAQRRHEIREPVEKLKRRELDSVVGPWHAWTFARDRGRNGPFDARTGAGGPASCTAWKTLGSRITVALTATAVGLHASPASKNVLQESASRETRPPSRREWAFHRLFTHRSFKTGPMVTMIAVILGSMALQGPVTRAGSSGSLTSMSPRNASRLFHRAAER